MKKETNQKSKRVGLFFGSFNPIHVGHLIVARKALDDTSLDELWFVVSPENPAKRRSGELEDADHRLEMVKKAIEGEPGFVACDIEFGLPRPSFTHDSLRLLRETNPDTHFSIVAGTDTQRKMGCYWKNRDEILEEHDIIVYPRTLSNKDKNRFKLTDKAHSVSTYLENAPQVDVSATYIRNNIQSNKSIKYLVSDVVIDHIKEHNLFNQK